MKENSSGNLYDQAWQAFNSAYYETGVQAQASRELGRKLLNEANRRFSGKEKLFAKLDAQNRLIDRAIELKRGQAVYLNP